MNQIDKLIERLKAHTPKEIDVDFPEAGILVLVTRNAQSPNIILTRRAQHMNTHKGQVAFPGGKFDEEDGTLEQTALRECHEEIGVEPENIEIIGQLSQVISLHGIRVTPYVGLVDESVSFIPNLDELDSIFKVPTMFFNEAVPKRRDKMTYRDIALSVPSYDFQHEGETYEIWGLSAIVMVELLNIAFDANITIFDEPLSPTNNPPLA
ncbi:MAG: 8-oxo-dGTP pyrophosphatase MutT (NUDIX family) [Oleiphilaceae bacterium]|jgi:8-oxo-dGTP pyrophosphatase MutT (NUDIX family)